jgi:hypothetical protein
MKRKRTIPPKIVHMRNPRPKRAILCTPYAHPEALCTADPLKVNCPECLRIYSSKKKVLDLANGNK